jgi:HesB-like selenoprotein
MINKMGTTSGDRHHRIHLQGIGWGGPVFTLVLDEQREDDYVENINGLKVLVNNDLIENYNEFEIDYTSRFLFKGFSVRTTGGYRRSC